MKCKQAPVKFCLKISDLPFEFIVTKITIKRKLKEFLYTVKFYLNKIIIITNADKDKNVKIYENISLIFIIRDFSSFGAICSFSPSLRAYLS